VDEVIAIIKRVFFGLLCGLMIGYFSHLVAISWS